MAVKIRDTARHYIGSRMPAKSLALQHTIRPNYDHSIWWLTADRLILFDILLVTSKIMELGGGYWNRQEKSIDQLLSNRLRLPAAMADDALIALKYTTWNRGNQSARYFGQN